MCGAPDTMLEKLKYLHHRLGMEDLIMYGQESRMSHDATIANIGLFGTDVLPVVGSGRGHPDIMPLGAFP